MRRTVCEQCKRSVALGELYTVAGRTVCKPCGDEELRRAEAEKPPPGPVVRLVDPTVCARCKLDNGDTPLPELAGAPYCERCADFLRHRPFPPWIKTSLAALLALAVLSFSYN